MIKYEDACELAYDYFNMKSKENIITSAHEHKSYWIFFGGVPDKIEYGSSGIKINKSTGAVEWFMLPQELDVFLEAEDIPVPDKFTQCKR